MARDEYEADDYYFAAGRIVLGLGSAIYLANWFVTIDLGFVTFQIAGWILPICFAITGAMVWLGPFYGRLGSVVLCLAILPVIWPFMVRGNLGAILLFPVLLWSIWSDWPWRRRTGSTVTVPEFKPQDERVLLLREPRELSRETLVELCTAAWQVPFSTNAQAENFVTGEPPLLVVKYGGSLLMVQYFAEPYFQQPEQLVAQLSHPQLKAAITDHTAWLCVELMATDVAPDKASAIAGTLVNQLLAANVLAIFAPDSGELMTLDRTVRGHAEVPDDDE